MSLARQRFVALSLGALRGLGRQQQLFQSQGLGSARFQYPFSAFLARSASSSVESPSSGPTEDSSLLLASLQDEKPHTLEVTGKPPVLPPKMTESILGKLAVKMLMFDNKWNQLIIGGQEVYSAITYQVDDGTLHRAFGMDTKVFYSTWCLLAIHVYLVLHRIGQMTDKETKFFRQRFYDHFYRDVERRIHHAGVQVGVGKWTKKLEGVFYTTSFAIDKVLLRESKETIEDILLREFFGNDSSKRHQAQLLTAYLLHELHCIQLTNVEALKRGDIAFNWELFGKYRHPDTQAPKFQRIAVAPSDNKGDGLSE